MHGPLSQLGRYEILGKIASGGMATVYRARMEGIQGFQKVVALKIMHPHLADDDHHITMFMDEGRLSARFTHPNLVSVFDFGELDAYRYMAMEYHHGLTMAHLWRYLRKKKQPLSMKLVLHVLRETLHGLDYAHNLKDEAGTPLSIIHRDISPENILLTTQGEVKVIDFGIALDAARRAVSKTGIVKGKITYMSPEQVSGRALDRRTDIYAAAVMAFELISGRHLFGDGSTDEIRRRIQGARKIPIKKNDLPNPLVEELLRGALSHDADERYKTAAQFREKVDSVIEELGWGIEPDELATVVREAKDTIEAEQEKARKKKAKAVDKVPEAAPKQGFGVGIFARAAMAIFALSLLLEIFGIHFQVTGPNTAQADTNQPTLQEELHDSQAEPISDPAVSLPPSIEP